MSNFSYPWIEPSGDQSKALDASIRSSAIGHVLALDGNEHEVYDTVENVLYIIDRSNLDPVRIKARRLTHELRRNLDVIRFAVSGAHYDNIVESLKELEAAL